MFNLNNANMEKFISISLFISACFLGSCSSYDDERIWQDLNEIEKTIGDLVVAVKNEAPFKTDWNSTSASVKDIFTRQYWFKVDHSQNEIIGNLMNRYQIEEADFLNDDQYGYYLTGNVTADQKAKFFSSLKEKDIKVYSLYEVY